MVMQGEDTVKVADNVKEQITVSRHDMVMQGEDMVKVADNV